MREERPFVVEQPIRYNYTVGGMRLKSSDVELSKDRRGRLEPRLFDTLSTPTGMMKIAEIFWHTNKRATVQLVPVAR